MLKSDKIILCSAVAMLVFGWAAYFGLQENFYFALIGSLGLGVSCRYIIYFFIDLVKIRPTRKREEKQKEI